MRNKFSISEDLEEDQGFPDLGGLGKIIPEESSQGVGKSPLNFKTFFFLRECRW